MNRVAIASALTGALVLGGCAVTPPTGPSVMALPPAGKNMETFQQDDLACRDYAMAQIGYASPAEAANRSAIGSAGVGTVLGAAAGAAIGAATGSPATGAAIGAGSGLVLGSAAGASNAQLSSAALQRQYDMSYLQCMAAKGNRIPTVAAAPGPYGYYYPYGPYGFPAY